MGKYDFYAEVRILSTPDTERLGIAGSTGVIMGMSEGPLGTSYSVSVDEIGNMVQESDLEATGRVFSREDFYDGSSISVSPQNYKKDQRTVEDQ